MNKRKVYLYNLNKELINVFESTKECANYFNYDTSYIYHNLKYCKKIRHKETKQWYTIKRFI